LLKVKNNVCDIFLNSGDSIKFVFNAVNFDRRDGEALERRQQHAAKRVAHGDAIAGFQRLELELAVEVVGFYHHNAVRFLEC
jgi:hypothetical protein